MLPLLKEVRELRGMSQKQLAKKCGVSQQLIAHVETGRQNISPQLHRALGRTLQVDPRIFNARTLDQLLDVLAGQDVEELMATSEGRHLISWIARFRIMRGDLFFASTTVNFESLVDR